MLLTSFVLFGCKGMEEELGKTVKVKIEVKNNSTKNLKIILFTPNDSLFKLVNINSLDSVIVEEGFLRPAPTGPTYYLTSSIDSAIIEFSDGKILLQTSGSRGNNDLINNILLDINYKYYETTNPEFTRKQFTITESDYLRAK